MALSGKHKAIAGAATAIVLLVGALALVMARVEPWLRASVDRRLAGSGFAITWKGLDVGLLGHVRLTGLALTEGSEMLLEVTEIEADPSLMTLLQGHLRLARVLVRHPVAHVDIRDGKPAAWLRLRDALKQEPRDPSAPARTLADRLGTLQVQQGRVDAKILGPAVWFTGPDVPLSEIDLQLDTATEGAASAALPAVLGGGKLALKITMNQGQLSAIAGQFAPMAQYVAPTTMADKLPKVLGLRVAGVDWQRNSGPSLQNLELVDLAGEATTLVRVAAIRVDAGTITLENTHFQTSRDQLRRAMVEVLPQGLPAEATVLLAAVETLRGDIARINLEHRGETWHAKAIQLIASFADVVASVAAVEVNADAKGADGHRPTRIDVREPQLTLPRSSLLLANARAQTELDALLALRKVAEPAPADDDDEADADPEAVPVPPPAAIKAPASKVPAADSHERPPQRWQRQIREAHAKLLLTRKGLEQRWPLGKWPDWLSAQVHGGRLTITGSDGAPRLGLQGGSLEVGSRLGPLVVGFEPFDRLGSWGRVALAWRRHEADKSHEIDLTLRGGGVAQLLGSRLPGLSVGDGAELDAQVQIRLPDDKHLDVQGHFDVQKMGIQWWRLADRPIADFGLSGVFEAHFGNNSWVFRTPEVRLGDARLLGSVEVLGIDGNPTIRLNLDAPMQDCGAMLASVPLSMTPTLGRVQAHGTMDFHLGVSTHLPGVGATAVELALGDTLCVVDHLGNIDLSEFKRSDWVRPVNENGKILDDVLIGPGSGSWTSTMNMPGYVHYVMWATEDPFLKHRGISEDLVAKALAIDLSSGRFVYGGSTITQQLVKNLFLKRTKALSRKFEEMLIVWQMEKVLGKARILEIYVNGVEFGPKVYGVTRAAWEFFQKKPSELRPKEAVYLAIIKPSPRSGWGTMRANGWGDWYEMKVGKYMDKLLADDSISQEQYEADKPWKPDFNPPARTGKPAGHGH